MRRGSWIAAALAVFATSCAQETTEPTTTTTTAVTTTTTTMPQPTTTETPPPGVLVFTKTGGFRHESIPAGVDAINDLAVDAGFAVTATEDASVFTPESLADFDVVVFLNTTGDVLDPAQQQAMEGFIAEGNGFLGVHSAADTEYDWPWYGGLVGAYFDSHPAQQSATVDVVEPGHPVADGLPVQVERFDEWYNYRSRPSPGVTVVATLDETTYEGGNMGESHPITWAQEYGGGRAVYTGFGHTVESYDEPLVRTLLSNAIIWAAEAG